MQHQSYGDEKFSKHLLKFNHPEGFSNQSNIGDNTSGCDCNNYKLNNNLVFSYSDK